MPKTKLKESVLHDWVHTLPFQMQALLLTAMRGPDGIEKHCTAKCIVRYLRGIVLKPAGCWSGENDNDFMWGDYSRFEEYCNTFWDDHDAYPHHFIMHLLHCAEAVGYKHPHEETSRYWHLFYVKGCRAFHMNIETHDQLDKRLNDFGCGIHNTQGNAVR